MKRFTVFSLICILAGIMCTACERDRGVYAANENANYHPRPAPKKELSGELFRVDMTGKTFAVRVDNGMEQTFKFDDSTTITGFANSTQAPAPAPVAVKVNQVSKAVPSSPLRNLVGREGSEMIVQWREDNDVKTATSIEVKQLSAFKKQRAAKRK